MTLAAPIAEPLVPDAASPPPDRSAGARCLRPDRHARQPHRRRQQLYRAAPAESDVPERAVRRIAPLAPATGDDLAAALAAAVPAAASARADRNRGAAARPAARLLHLARRAPAGEARRRARARVRRMVAARGRDRRGAGLFPGRGRKRRTLLAVSRRRRRGPRHRRSQLGSCMASSHDGPLCRAAGAPRISRSCAARRLRGAVRPGRRTAAIEALGHHRPQHARRHRARA